MFVGARRGRVALAGVFLAVALVAGNLVALVGSNVAITPASADTAPVDPSLPETVTAAPLPTVQINGVVYSQVIVGNRVYVTGNFSQARPAGAAAGTNQTRALEHPRVRHHDGEPHHELGAELERAGSRHHRVDGRIADLRRRRLHVGQWHGAQPIRRARRADGRGDHEHQPRRERPR